jgi:hypothetical protein
MSQSTAALAPIAAGALRSTDPNGPIVFIGTPAYSGCHPLYVMSLVNTLRDLGSKGFRTQVYFSQGCSIITNAREELLGAFLASRADYLAMVDSDLGWPADLIARLIAFGEPVTAAAVPYRTIDAAKIEAGTYSDGITFNTTPSSPEELARCPQKNGFVQVSSVGTAFILLRRDAIMAMVRRFADLEIDVSGLLSYALFHQLIGARRHAGEDTSFFQRWTHIGGQIWVLTDAEITHTGPVSVGGNLARKMEGTIDPAGRWISGGNHILKDLPGAAPPAHAPAPAPAPTPAALAQPPAPAPAPAIPTPPPAPPPAAADAPAGETAPAPAPVAEVEAQVEAQVVVKADAAPAAVNGAASSSAGADPDATLSP